MQFERLPEGLRTLISQGDLEKRIEELAAEIDRDFEGADSLLCIGVLKGSVFFLTDLLKQVEAEAKAYQSWVDRTQLKLE